MKLINTNKELENQLMRLVQNYQKIAIATAWASSKTGVFKALVKHKQKLVNAVIGTHFYQTDPEVLQKFVESDKVRFILQPHGVFHPKVYLFWSKEAWEVVIGSPNLTVGALNKNSELSVLITSSDRQPSLKKQIIQVINAYWNQAKKISQVEADYYRRLQKLKKPSLQILTDIFGDQPTNKPAVQSKVMTMDWQTYRKKVKKVKNDKVPSFEQRLEMLSCVKEKFNHHKHFKNMSDDERKGIAGLESYSIKNSKYFGSMMGAGRYKNRINKNNPNISLALDKIPLNGEIRKNHYEQFIAEYLKAYPEGGAGLATVTRLLAMKRPDVFLCVDGKNMEQLCKDIGIDIKLLKNKQDLYKNYWTEVTLRLMNSPWWQSPEPSDKNEKDLWNYRAAMLDAILYEG
jgi:HKD family nuclease